MVQHFLQIVDRAHVLRLNQPRQALSAGFAREMATLALESKRLGEAVEWLWHRGANEPMTQSPFHSGEVQAITRFAVALSQTWLVRRLIRNGVVRKLAKWFLAKVSTPTAA